MHLLLLLILVAFVSYCAASAGASPQQQPTPPPVSGNVTLPTPTPQPSVTATPTPRPTQPLTSEMVQSWCQSDLGRCVPQRFAQLVEENKAVNPHAVVVKAGLPIAMNVPKGKNLRVQYSDCNNNLYTSNDGGYFPQVCGMTIRQFR